MKSPNLQTETPLNPAHPDHNPAPCQTDLDCYANSRDENNPKDHQTNSKEKIMGQSTPLNISQPSSSPVEVSPHIPFDNPETEAYWNRPCRHGKYPYPDENVFLVGGARFLGSHLVSVTEPSIIVSLTPELAQAYYGDVSNDLNIKPISCLSLAQAKSLQHRLIDSSESSIKIKPNLMNALFYSREIFLLVGTDLHGVSIEQSIQATTMKEIMDWAQQEQIQVIGVLPESALSETIQEMEKIQRGDREGHENYAYDYDQIEDLLESDIRIASRSIEEKDKSDDLFLRLCKNNMLGDLFSCSTEEFGKIENSFRKMKEARHQGTSTL